jgi:hypothetical protein
MCIFPCTDYGVNGNNDQLGDFPHLVQLLDGVGHIPGFIHQASRNERRTPRRSYRVQDTVYGSVRNHEAEIRLFSGRRAEGRLFENGGRYEKSLPQIRSRESWLLATQ